MGNPVILLQIYYEYNAFLWNQLIAMDDVISYGISVKNRQKADITNVKEFPKIGLYSEIKLSYGTLHFY